MNQSSEIFGGDETITIALSVDIKPLLAVGLIGLGAAENPTGAKKT